jgi:hypothetical protein
MLKFDLNYFSLLFGKKKQKVCVLVDCPTLSREFLTRLRNLFGFSAPYIQISSALNYYRNWRTRSGRVTQSNCVKFRDPTRHQIAYLDLLPDFRLRICTLFLLLAAPRLALQLFFVQYNLFLLARPYL